MSLDTHKFDAVAAQALCLGESERLGLPVDDPMRVGPAFERLVDAALGESAGE